MIKKILLSGLLLGLPLAALADPVKLTDEELDRVTAGTSALLNLPDGSSFVVLHNNDHLRIQGTVIRPGEVVLTINGRQIPLATPAIDMTVPVMGSAQTTVLVSQLSPSATASSSASTRFSSGNVMTTVTTDSVVTSNTTAVARSSSSSAISMRSVVITGN